MARPAVQPTNRSFFPRPAFTRIGATTTFIGAPAGSMGPRPMPQGHSVMAGLWR